MSEITNKQQPQHLSRLVHVAKGTRYYDLQFADGTRARLYIIAKGIFRLIVDPAAEFKPLTPSLTIAASNFSLRPFEDSQLLVTDETFTIKSGQFSLRLQKNPAIFSIFDDQLHRYRMMQSSPIELGSDYSSEFLRQNKNEFYYGGGMQNGSFSHKGKIIEIKNTNLTGPGAVACPEGFFWSNAGFAELRNTWKDGIYNFKGDDGTTAVITHQTPIFDNFYLLGDSPAEILRQYYKITGSPLFLPKYALGLGYLGNYLDTCWTAAKPQENSAIKFEDGNTYKIAHSNDDIVAKSSLNGEEQYQFSARAMIERYNSYHLPLSWFVPNYESKQDLNEDEMNNLVDFAKDQNVKIGFYGSLPTDAPANFLKFKTDPANFPNEKIMQDFAIASEPLIDKNQTNRPWAMASNGWSAIQTLATTANEGVGGEWEQIATEIASFLSMSLSGQPNVGSAIDGKEGGGNAQVNIRDLQWKVFTPLLYSIDNYGNIQKTPFAFNAKMTRITRAYLKLREKITPYLYTLTRAAQDGMPIVRPLFLAFPHERVNYTNQVKHEFMLGNNLLIAPITNGREDPSGASLKDNLYLPDHRTMWIDLFTGKKLIGGRIYDKLHYPLWHLPVYVRGGAILQESLRSALVYPQSKSSAILYEDDNQTNDYEKGHAATTQITSSVSGSNLHITVYPTEGSYTGLEEKQITNLTIMSDRYPGKVSLKLNDQFVPLTEYNDLDSFNKAEEGIFYQQDYMPCKEFGYFTGQLQPALRVKMPAVDIHDNKFELMIENFSYGSEVEQHAIIDSAMASPRSAAILTDRLTSKSITITWTNPTNFADKNIMADIEVNGIVHTNIDGNTFTFHELEPNTRYRFRIRNKFGNKVSDWSEYFGTHTKRDQMDYAISNVTVSSTGESEEDLPVENLTDLKLASEWLSKDQITKDSPLDLTFNFKHIYKLSRMVYVPRSRDRIGHVLRVQVAISKDGENFSDFSKEINWPNDAKNKVIGLRDVVAKSIKLRILATSDNLASGKEVLFFMAKE